MGAELNCRSTHWLQFGITEPDKSLFFSRGLMEEKIIILLKKIFQFFHIGQIFFSRVLMDFLVSWDRIFIRIISNE